ARSSAGLIGRSGPFSRRTESSSFSATTSRSPRSRACRRYVVCPRWTTSKHPFVKTTRRPSWRARSTASASSSWSTTVAAGAVAEVATGGGDGGGALGPDAEFAPEERRGLAGVRRDEVGGQRRPPGEVVRVDDDGTGAVAVEHRDDVGRLHAEPVVADHGG